MSPAYLHAVPDPEFEPDEAPSDPRERLTAVQAVAVPCPAVDNQLETAPADDDRDAVEDLVDGQEAGERAGWMPDLRPYWDVRQLPIGELGSLAVEIGQTTGPPLGRALARFVRLLGSFCRILGQMILWYWSGLRVLLALLLGWLSGSLGRGGSAGARLGGAAFLAYCVIRTAATYPVAPWVMGGVLLVLTLLACTGKIAAPQPKASKKGAAKAGKKGVKDEGPETSEMSAKEAPAADVPAAGGIAKEGATAEPSRGLLGSLVGRLRGAADETPANPSDEDAEEASEEAEEEAPDEVEETPAEDPLTALIRKEIGAENGVHLQDLRPALRLAFPLLSTASDADLRQLLTQAGWNPNRTFRARGAAGRAGVHRDELPPLPSPGGPPEPLSKPLSTPGESPRPANSSAAESGGEWTEEERRQGHRFVQDTERGPAAWKIEYLEPRDRP
ncbi:hypothetical protein AB0A05_07500 [Streptomyces sp. NPDC046374]|uniref:hypothetical protein n=1 Tax=Streptomyces sp. NPDC046374 TaxID=3154917 RepID=UPI0033F13174